VPRSSVDAPIVAVRWPCAEDREAPFEPSGGLRGRVEWNAMLAHHGPATGRFVFIAECEGAVVGAATVTVYADELEVEVLARNAASQAARGARVGFELLKAADARAWANGCPNLTLESLDDAALIAFYEREGFSRAGPPLFDAYWGTRHPMRRPLSSATP
jgi:GNAT superfamily N-acetyltransferase